MIDFNKPTKENYVCGGVQKLWFFKNGYGASVTNHFHIYDGDEGLWGLSLLVGDEKTFDLCFDREITKEEAYEKKREKVEI